MNQALPAKKRLLEVRNLVKHFPIQKGLSQTCRGRSPRGG